ncbi:MAG: hypothetical protein AAGG46_01950, partial [Planctomycetota bacterium]
REVRLSLLAPVVRNADEVRLELNLPRATNSELELRSDKAVASPTATEGVLLPIKRSAAGGSILRLRGAVGPTTLAFRTATSEGSGQQALLRARGELELAIDDRSVRSTATITVDGLGRPFRRFVIRLPEGATLLPDPGLNDAGLRFEAIDAQAAGVAASSGGGDGSFVRVSRPTRSTDPVAVTLSAATPLGDRDGEDNAVDLGGFDVVGAVLQTGDVAIVVDDGVQVDWGRPTGATRLETAELPETLLRESPSFAVRYFRQAWKLPVRVGVRETRVEVTPTYRLEIAPEAARLTLDADYRVFGRGVLELAYELNDWPVPADDPTGPVGLIDVDRVRHSGSRWVAPLNRAASRGTQVSLRFEQSYTAAAADGQTPKPQTAAPQTTEPGPIELRLPTPVADSLGVGSLIVVTHPSIELSVDAEQTTGLEPVAVTPSDLAEDDPAGLRTRAYRIAAADLGEVRFVAEGRSRPGRLQASSRGEVRLTGYASEVDQTLRFNALYQPVDEVLLWAPAGVDLGQPAAFELSVAGSSNPGRGDPTDAVLLTAERVVRQSSAADSSPAEPSTAERKEIESEPVDGVSRDGAQPSEQPVVDDPVNSNPDDSKQTPSEPLLAEGTAWRVVLPGPRLGAFQLRTRFTAAHASPEGEVIAPPLLHPMEAASVVGWQSEVTVVAPEGEAVVLADDAEGWRAPLADGPQASVQAVGGPTSGPLRVRLAELATAEPVSAVIRRAWFQTWDRGGQRQLRAAYQLTGSSDRLEMLLPAGIDAGEVELRLDGRTVAPTAGADGRLVLTDATLGDGEPHTLESRLLRPIEDAFATPLAPPRLVAETRSTECYWELIQPADQHVWRPPAGFSSLYRWGWSDRGWGRQPTRSTEQIAAELAAAVGPPVAAGEHRYVFARIGLPDDAPATRSVSRTSAVVVASSAILVAAFLLSRSGLLRYQATFYALVMGVGVAGALVPGVFVLAVQAGAFGLLLAAATLIATRTIHRARRPTSIVLEGKSTDHGGQTPQVIGGHSALDAVSTNAPTVSITAGDSSREA